MQHMNTVILPSLGHLGGKSTISQNTTCNWLVKLGYQSGEVKKGLYIDGHEQPDVIQAYEKFLRHIALYRKYVWPSWGCCSYIITFNFPQTDAGGR